MKCARVRMTVLRMRKHADQMRDSSSPCLSHSPSTSATNLTACHMVFSAIESKPSSQPTPKPERETEKLCIDQIRPNSEDKNHSEFSIYRYKSGSVGFLQ